MTTDTKKEVEAKEKATAAKDGSRLICEGVLLPQLLSHLTLKEFKQASTVNREWKKVVKEQKVLPSDLSPRNAQACANLLSITCGFDTPSVQEAKNYPFGLKTAALSRLCYLKLLNPDCVPIKDNLFSQARALEILHELSNQRHLISSFYEAIAGYEAAEVYFSAPDVSSDIEEAIHDKLGRVARSCLELLEKIPSHTDALYEMAYLIENKSITLEADRPIFKNWTDCDYLKTSSSPEDEKNPSSLPIYSSAAYVRYQDSLFYISHGNTRFEEIKLTSEQVKKLDDEITPRKITRTLSTPQLDTVQRITGHTHNKQSLENPDLQACFLYRRILAIDPGHSNALAGLAKQIIKGTTKARPSDFPNLEISQIPTDPNEQAKILCLRALKSGSNVQAVSVLAKLIDEAKVNYATGSRNLLFWQASVFAKLRIPDEYRMRDKTEYRLHIAPLRKDLYAASLFNQEPFSDYNRVSKAAFLEKMGIGAFMELTREQRSKFHTIENTATVHFDFLIKSADLESEEEKRALRRLAEIHDLDKAKDSVLYFLNNPTDRARIIEGLQTWRFNFSYLVPPCITFVLTAGSSYGIHEWDLSGLALDSTSIKTLIGIAAFILSCCAAIVAAPCMEKMEDNRIYAKIFSADPSNNPLETTGEQQRPVTTS